MRKAASSWITAQCRWKSTREARLTADRRVVAFFSSEQSVASNSRARSQHAFAEHLRALGYAVTSHAAQGKTVDEVLVVASSQSFAAVSQESFYVGISRARERARIYTDDAELLGRRVRDTHTRKAAVELEGLRAELAKAGFKRTVTPAAPRVALAPTLGRTWRQMRTLRVQRLAPVLRIGQWVQSLRQWLDQRQPVVRQATETVAPRRIVTARQVLMGLAKQTQQPDPPRQSRGMRM